MSVPGPRGADGPGLLGVPVTADRLGMGLAWKGDLGRPEGWGGA